MKKTVETKRDFGNGIKLAVFSVISILAQVLWIYIFIEDMGHRFPWISLLITVLSALLVLLIYNDRITASVKMPWIILILAFPVLGTFLLLLVGFNRNLRFKRKQYSQVDEELVNLIKYDIRAFEQAEEINASAKGLVEYVHRYSGFVPYVDTDIEYYNDALKGFEAQLKDLKEAKDFIFMEYHAIEDAKAFGMILDILKEKAAQGVEVRLFYDYVGSMGFIGNSFVKELENYGINARVFNPAVPFVNLFLNNRDHRKITVIDGKIGFTGGYNLADEYFHFTEPFGNWLDTGVRLEGNGVKSLTMIFLENWNAMSREHRSDADFIKYFPKIDYKSIQNPVVIPYADNPMSNERLCENIYMQMLRSAKKYCYFITPYLIITDEMKNAFSLAAKSGVDVRIITPGIPDKKLIYNVTRSYYENLILDGVRIFEYTPGFCHAKQCIFDDQVAICGTSNLDYRSLYHHFENGVIYYNCKAVADTKQMFDDTFAECREVTEEYKNVNALKDHFLWLILRLAAPLM